MSENKQSQGGCKCTCAETLMPILDILPRLWSTGHITVQQNGKWWLFDRAGEGVLCGETFRDLCVNIIMADL